MNSSIFKAYDIRGIYPTEVNEDMAEKIGRALVAYSKANNIVVGQDMRTSSPALTQRLIKGITSSGANVIDVGLVSTPTFYFAVRHIGASAGIQVSASHNPKEYNGFKVVLQKDGMITKVGIESGLGQIRDLVEAGTGVDGPVAGTVKKITGIGDAEIDAALKIIPLPSSMPPLTIVADPANAMGAPYLDALFARIPSVKLIRMNFDLDGTFPSHQPDPLQFDTLRALQERMRIEHADLGIAPDGDGDRLFFLDEKANVIPASHITALVAREILKKHRSEKMFYDIRYTWSARKTMEAYGGTALTTKVGHAFISEALRREDGAFAGESSGHFFFRDTGYAEGPLLVLLYILNVIALEKKPMSEIIAPVVHSVESGEINFHLESRDKVVELLKRLENHYHDGAITKMDGIAIDFPTWRASVRASNTEALVRLNIEGETREIVEKKKAEISAIIGGHGL